MTHNNKDDDDDDIMIDDCLMHDDDDLLDEACNSGHATRERRIITISPTTILWTRQSTIEMRDSSLSVDSCHSGQLQSNTMTTEYSLNTLAEDLLAYTACFLNVGSLKQARMVNRKFNRVLSTDKAGWKAHLQRLAQRRRHVASTSLHDEATAKDAYRLACTDARLRHWVRPDELIYDCDGPTFSRGSGSRATVWSFRFKQVAGAEWTQHDPWHQGRAARQMVFLANGTVRQLSATGTLQPPFYDSPNLSGGLEIRWRFVTQPIDLPKKECGAYVRLTIAGRDVPTYMVHRSPTGDWSFCLENCWGLFSSFPLPPRASLSQSAVVNHHVAAVPRMRLRRDAHGGARWLDVSQEESDEEEEIHEDHDHRHDKTYLLEDAYLNVTCRWQWREALLYNLGASILPDGPNACRDFDRAWNLSMRGLRSFGFPTTAAAAAAPAVAAVNNGDQEEEELLTMDDLEL